jgi:ADP-dependent NAD(P)H-hydrate dehydratase / NAD(P)H-hydrate epimerase
MKTLTIKQMRELDARTIAKTATSGIKLMKIAGMKAAEQILSYTSKLPKIHVKRFIIVAGKGNNGGDGFVIGKYLSKHTKNDVIIYSTSSLENLTLESKHHAQLCKNIEIIESVKIPTFQSGDIIIDTLLGTGATGELRAPYNLWIDAINRANLPTISIDIPPGLNGDNGLILSSAVLADLTITIGFPKPGFVLKNGPNHCGIIKCIDIGIPLGFSKDIQSDFEIFFQSDVNCLTRRSSDSYKNKNGHLLVIGGSLEYQGAPILAAKAAMRSGAGIVTLAIPKSANIKPTGMDSLIVKNIEDSDKGYFSKNSAPILTQLAEKADAIVIGPGISTNSGVIDMIKNLHISNKVIIWDADALNILALTPLIINSFKDNNCTNICTPHVGEMKRLINGFELPENSINDRISCAEQFSHKTNFLTILKGKNSVIAYKRHKTSINSSGSAALATAGSGDVLTGIIGALIVQNIKPFESVKSAVFIHGLASELSTYGVRGFSADDLITLIPKAMREISPFA